MNVVNSKPLVLSRKSARGEPVEPPRVGQTLSTFDKLRANGLQRDDHASPNPLPICQVVDLGTVEYRKAWDLQVKISQAVHDGSQPNTLLLLEHPHVYTKGRLSKDEHLLLTPEDLVSRGIDLVETDRGGQITYHGPGQVVAYPVVNLRDWGGPLKYVRTLERIIIDILADFGITAGLVEGLTGVWAGNRKIAAIGVKISRGVTHHGVAINVNTDLAHFRHIVPCGITDRQVTSMEQQLGHQVDLALVKRSASDHIGQRMGFEMQAENAVPSSPLVGKD